MALDKVHNQPEFNYIHRVEKQSQNRDGKKQQDQNKKKDQKKSDSLFGNLADSLHQYSDEPFQFNG